MISVSFNRSGAIVWILTLECHCEGLYHDRFQSLRRDSLDSYKFYAVFGGIGHQVSIAQAR